MAGVACELFLGRAQKERFLRPIFVNISIIIIISSSVFNVAAPPFAQLIVIN